MRHLKEKFLQLSACDTTELKDENKTAEYNTRLAQCLLKELFDELTTPN